MRIIETLIRKLPRSQNGRHRLSVDTDIWENVDDIATIREFCLDRFADEISADSPDSGYQLRSPDALRLETEGMAISFVAVPQELYCYLVTDRDEYRVPAGVYRSLEPYISLVGYDVCDRLMISAFEHGSSPYFGGYGHDSMINRYGLFDREEDATLCALENNRSVPEHYPWYAVALYVTDATLRKLAAPA